MTVAESEGLKQFSTTGALPAFTSSTFKLLGDTTSFIEDVGGSVVQKFDKDFVPPKSVSNWFREAEDNTYYKPSDSYTNIQNEIGKQTKDKDFVGSLLGFGKAIVDNPIDVVQSIPEMIAQSAPNMIATVAGGEIAAPLLAGKIAIAGNALKTATAIGDKVAVESATKALALLAKEKTALDITAGIVTTTPSYTRAIAEQKAIHQGMTPEEARHANLAQMETDPTMIAHGALSAAFDRADISIFKAGFNQSVKLGADALGRSMPSVAKLLGQEVLHVGGAMVGEGLQEFAQAVNESYASTGSVDWNDAKTQGFMGSIGGLGFHGAGKLLGATVGVGSSIKEAGDRLIKNPVESKATTETGGSAITKTPEEIDANIENLNKIVEEYSANPENSPEKIEQVKSEAKTRIEALTKQKELLTQPTEEAPVVKPITEEQVASMPIEEIANSQEASKIKVDELISKPTSENDEFIMLNDWEKSAMSEEDRTRLGSKNLFEKTTGKELNIDTKRDDSIFTVQDIYAGRFNPKSDANIETVSNDIHNDILGFKKMFETATKSQNRMGLEYTKNNMNRYMARMYNTEAKRVNVSGEAKEARLIEYNNFVLAYKAMFGENPTGIAPAIRGKKEVMTTQAKELFIEAVKQTDVMVKDLFARPNAKQETFQNAKEATPVKPQSTNSKQESKSTPKETKSIVEPPRGKYTNHSGGAIGADTIWGKIGEKFGVKSNHYWHKNKTPNGNKEISEADTKEGQQKVTTAARQMGRIEKTHTVRDERLIRNWSQVKYADAIFAITTMLSVGSEMNYGKKALIQQGKGGTGYAIQMAINEGKPVYVFDQIRNAWFKNINGKWEKSEVPTLTKNFAGIGTREINENGIKAINEVYEKSFNTKQEPTRKSLLNNPVAHPESEEELIANANTSKPKIKLSNNPSDEELASAYVDSKPNKKSNEDMDKEEFNKEAKDGMDYLDKKYNEENEYLNEISEADEKKMDEFYHAFPEKAPEGYFSIFKFKSKYESVFNDIESIPEWDRESKTGILADNIAYIFKTLNIFKKSESFKPLGYLNTPVALHDENIPKETAEYFGKFMKLVSGVYTSFEVGVIAPEAFMDERFQEAIFMNTIAKLSNKEVTDEDDESGTDLYSMVSTIGTSTIKSLGLSYADDVTFDDSQNAKTYIGLTGIETMRQLGVVKFVQRDGKTYVEKVKDIELPHRARQFLSAQLQLEPVLNTDRKDKTNISIDRAEMFDATQEQVKAVNKYEKVEYSINTDFISWLDDNGITDNDLLNIEGYENNVGQKDRLTALMEFAGDVEDRAFNFTYKIGNNSRLYIMETVANIQTDKAFARNMVTFNKKVKVTDKNMQFYKQAVIFGVTGKLSQNIDSDFNDITEEINNLTEKQYLDYAKAHQGVHTLLAISDYKSYLDNKSNHKTGLYIEVDGKTNGFAFAVMQLYKDNKDMLAKVGVTTDIKDKVMDGYEEVSASIVNKFTGSVRDVTINRNLVKKSFTEFLYGSSSKNVIERIANRIIDAGKENKIDYDAKEKEQINILALMIDSELRIKYARLLPYIALVKKTYDIMYKNFQSKVNTEFYDKINEKTTLKEYNKIKSDFMRKYAPSISLFGDAVKNKIPLYKTVMTPVGVGKTVNQNITIIDKSGTRTVALPFGSRDFMPDASNSKAAPVITHFLDALCASESSNDDSDTSLIHDAFIGTIEGLINDTSGKYNENFMEIGTGINVLDKLMEIIVGLGVNTNTLNVKYQTTGGINVDGTFVEGSFQKIFDKLKYGDKHSVLGQVSSVNQMESATVDEEVKEQPKKVYMQNITKKQREFLANYGKTIKLTIKRTERYNRLIEKISVPPKLKLRKTGLMQRVDSGLEKEDKAKAIKLEMDMARDNRAEADYYGSMSDEDLDQLFSDPEAEFNEKIKEFDLSHDKDALLNVFDELKSMSTEENKETHLGYLRDLVAKISSHMAKITETEKINVFKAIGDSHGAYDKKTGNIDIAVGNFMTHNSLSTAEVFAHELLHKAFSYALDANVRYRNEANKLMNAVKKEMDAKGGFNLLLERDAKGNVTYLYNTKDEALMAKKTYDYIFSSNHEFLAFFATNERFRDIVQGLDVSVEKHENESWFGKVYNFIADLIDKLIYKIDGQTVAERADKLLNDMYLTNKQFASTAEQSVFNQYEQFFNSKLNAKAAEMLIKYSGKLLQAVNKVGGKLVKTVDEVAFILTKKRISEMALIRSLANQIMHSTDKWENILKISQQKNKYSQDSETISTGMTVAIRNTLAGSTINEREALKLSMVDTDMQALSGYTTAQMIDLVGKNEYRYSEMKKIRNKLLSMAKSREEQEYIYYVINQSEGLGVYMAENSARLRGNQYLNIENILKNAPISTKKVKLDASLVENLATLSAIEFTNEIVRLEAYQYAVANQQAVEDVIKMHGVVAKESKAKLFDAFGDSHYYIKGYTTELNSKTVDVVVRPLREKAQLEEQEYKFISKPESSSAIDGQYAQEQMGVFVRYNLVPKYTQGLLSIQDFAVKGTKLNELNFADRTNGDIITGSEKVVADMTRIQYAEQCKGIINFRSKAGHQLVPVLDPFGKIVNYRYTMSKENKRNILGQNHEIDKVLGNMNGDNYRKISSIAIDQEIIREMLSMQHDAKDLSNFVPVTAYGKYQDFYRMIPKKTLEYLNSIKPKDEPLMVHKDLIETMFGYRNVTVQDIKFFQGKKAGRLLAWAERIWQDFVAHSREGITIKNPRVVGGNIISNTNTLITHGMSPDQAVLKQLEGAKLLDEYRALKTEWVGLDIQRKIGKKINEARFKELAKQIANSPLLPLLKKGQFQSIIDDVNLEKMDSTNIVELYGDAMLGKLPKEARRIIDEAYISKDTETFQKLLKVVQYSDFVAKYALYDFQTKKKGMSSDKAMKLVSDMFVDYSLVQNKWVKYADDMSIFMFSKYLFRIQKAIARNLVENPIPMMSSMLAQRMTYDISSIDDSSLLRRNPLNRLFMLNPLDELVPHSLDYVPLL